MPNFLLGSAYGISVALILYAISAGIIAPQLRFPIVLIWAVAGLLLAFTAIWRKPTT
jgi:hypothetical protein